MSRKQIGPGAFYFAGPNNDWTWPQNGNLWQDGVKTLFDPCPSGWRVPKSGADDLSPWADFALPGTKNPNSPTEDPGSGVTAGYDFYTTIPGVLTWYGFHGLRYATAADIGYMGIGSRHHTSSLQSTFSAYLLFLLKNEILPSTAAMQAYGYPVRCVRE